ncbi:MAG: hypothetical protein M3T55_12245 [Pseudomonadota bacterium]|nr:hypothetical protein [Pseudomonadota bacterium]
MVADKEQPKPAADDALGQTGFKRRLKVLSDELDELEEQVNPERPIAPPIGAIIGT